MPCGVCLGEEMNSASAGVSEHPASPLPSSVTARTLCHSPYSSAIP